MGRRTYIRIHAVRVRCPWVCPAFSPSAVAKKGKFWGLYWFCGRNRMEWEETSETVKTVDSARSQRSNGNILHACVYAITSENNPFFLLCHEPCHDISL